MIDIHPVVRGVIECGLIEQVLAGDDVLRLTHGACQIGVSGQVVGRVIAGQLDAVDPALRIIVRGHDQSRPELSLIECVLRLFVKTIQPQVGGRCQLMRDTGIQVICPFGLDR